jgi:deoxyribose-phosphate aldolase
MLQTAQGDREFPIVLVCFGPKITTLAGMIIMNLTTLQLAQMVDISAVRADSVKSEVESIVTAAKENHFICVFTLPCFASYAHELLQGTSGIHLGGAIGFPSGAATTTCKLFEAEELVSFGCNELDMVINIGKLKSGLFQDVADDIKQIVRAAGTLPVKVILEVSLLKDSEIQDGARIARDAGAQFVKTGTGWAGPTTFEHISLIKKAVGETVKLKVAGGVRSLDVLLEMHQMGVSRFGIGYKSALSIMDEFYRKVKA